ncbi:MAG: hypothetical protein ACOC1K_02235 [Nanoarchaeota archaeon]
MIVNIEELKDGILQLASVLKEEGSHSGYYIFFKKEWWYYGMNWAICAMKYQTINEEIFGKRHYQLVTVDGPYKGDIFTTQGGIVELLTVLNIDEIFSDNIRIEYVVKEKI